GRRRIDLDGDGRAEGRDRDERYFLRVIQRSRQSFLVDPEGGRQDRSPPTDASRTGATGAGSADDSGLFAAGPGSFGAQFLDLARPFAAGVAAAWDPHLGGSQSLSARALHGRVQCSFSSAGSAARECVCPPLGQRSGPDLRTTVRTYRKPG